MSRPLKSIARLPGCMELDQLSCAISRPHISSLISAYFDRGKYGFNIKLRKGMNSQNGQLTVPCCTRRKWQKHDIGEPWLVKVEVCSEAQNLVSETIRV